MSELNELEQDFVNEQKGEGSLSVYLANNGEKGDYLGWDIHLENIEALYFDGIGVPRWDSLEAETVEEKTALYWERFNAVMEALPLIGRMRDTDEEIDYSAAEIDPLTGECDRVLLGTTNEKAVRAAQKISRAAWHAAEAGAGLKLVPSQIAVPMF